MVNSVPTFEWKNLGDISVGRPFLGPMTRVAVYRLMQFTMRSTLIHEFGEEKTRTIFRDAGKLAGMEFCRNILNAALPLSEFIADLHHQLVDQGIGILKIEKADVEKMNFTLTVSEDLDCSGLPMNGETVCDYDEGFIAGIFKVYCGVDFVAREVDCWANGDRTCRFVVHVGQ